MTLVSTKLKHVAKFRIDLPKSYRILETAIEQYNVQFPKPKLKLPHIFLARELIRLYAMEFQRWQAARGFAVQLDWEEMPLLATNNEFLGDITGRTSRSIRNYRKALEKAGFFAPVDYGEDGEPTFTAFHGRTCDFELAIMPDFMWIEGRHSTARLTPQNAPTLCLRPNGDLTTRSRKNFPPTSTSTVTSTEQEQLELVGGKKSSDAENFSGKEAELLESSASNQPEQPELLGGKEPEQPEPVNWNEQSRQAAGTAGEAGPAAADNEEELLRREMVRSRAIILFKYLQTWLYPGEVFSQGRRQAILARLAALYGNARPDKARFARITANYRDRMKLVQMHWHKEHGALPEPEEFFDTSNKNGFILTRAWMDNPQKYPPPHRASYRVAGESRGSIRRKKALLIRDII